MNAKKLRIGNYVLLGGMRAIVVRVYEESIGVKIVLTQDDGRQYNVDPMYGIWERIPLTKGWLEAFGFGCSNGYSWSRWSDRWETDIQFLRNYADDNAYQLMESPGVPVRVEYVDQLQNLWHELIGEDLTESSRIAKPKQ